MDQGDALPPDDFNVDWSWMEADWSSGCDVPSTILDTQPQHLLDTLGSTPSAESTTFQSNSFSNLWMQTEQDSVAHSRGVIPFSYEYSANYSIPGNHLAGCPWPNEPLPVSIASCHDDTSAPSFGPSSFISMSEITNQPLEVRAPSIVAKAHNVRHEPKSLKTTSSKNKQRPAKPRKRCTYAECSLTFPRVYELNRHVQNVHDRAFTMGCPVYGCSRISKPFGRADKFREHFRKQHNSVHSFLCLFKDCDQGPFSLTPLALHLVSYHLHEYSSAHDLDEVMKIVSPDILRGKIIFQLEETKLISAAIEDETVNQCPLLQRGCDFRDSAHRSDLIRHMIIIHGHNLVNPSRFYDLFKKYGGACNVVSGPTLCFCQKWHGIGFCRLADHFKHDHSEQEQRENARELYEIFDPFLSKKEVPYWYANGEFSRNLRKWHDQDFATATILWVYLKKTDDSPP